MLLPEQYLGIYLLTIFLCNDRDIRAISCFSVIAYLLCEVEYLMLKQNMLEFVVVSYSTEFILAAITSSILDNRYTRLVFSVSYAFCVINLCSLLIASASTRYPFTETFVLFLQASKHVNKFINEIVVALIMYKESTSSNKTVYLHWFITINYIFKVL